MNEEEKSHHKMTQSDIIRLAQEAGIEYSKNLNQMVSPYCDGVHMDEFEKFINLVAAAEREALESLIEHIKNDWEWAMDSQMKVYAAEYLLSAIRARGQV